MDSGGRPRYVLEQIAERYAIVMPRRLAVDRLVRPPLDFEYLREAQSASPPRCGGALGVGSPVLGPAVAGLNTHGTCCRCRLNEATLAHVVRRVSRSCRISSNSPAHAREPQHLRRLRGLDAERVGSFLSRPVADATGCGPASLMSITSMSPASITTLILVEYLRSLPHHARRAVPTLAGHTHCGHAPDRHARWPGDGGGVGTVPPGSPAHRRRLDAAGVGREKSRPLPRFMRKWLKAKDFHGRAGCRLSRRRPIASAEPAGLPHPPVVPPPRRGLRSAMHDLENDAALAPEMSS